MVRSKSAFEKLEAEIVKDAGEYVKEKVKRKAIKLGEISGLVIIGLILISFGIANLIGYYIPILSPGYNFVIFGVLLLLISFAIKV